MKKTFSIILAFVFVLCICSSAFAENETRELVWSERADGVDWYIDEVDTSFWLPESYNAVELTEQDLADDIIGFLVTEQGSYLGVFYSGKDSFSLYNYFGYCKDIGKDVEIVIVNKIPAVLQRDTENNLGNLVFQTQDGYFFQLSFYPLSDEALMEQIFSSVRPKTVEEQPDVVEQQPAPTNPVSSLISK